MTFLPDVLSRCWFLAGPTASGKTEVSLLLAERIGAEIVSLDSMAIYRGMDIGTAKPGLDEQMRVRHHLIDIADPSEEFSVADFLRLADSAAIDILNRDRVPMFVGGTGLYLRSILRGISEGPAPDWSIRSDLENSVSQRGPQWLHDQLRSIDPITADRLHTNDVRRVIRAIEVFRKMGRPISEEQSHRPRPVHERPRCVVWFEPPRDWLYNRINDRVATMIERGWLEETCRLMERSPPWSRTASQALGYQDLVSVAEGRMTLSEAVENIQTATRQFAKRQHTWFRNLEECHALAVSGNESPEELCGSIQAIVDGSARR